MFVVPTCLPADPESRQLITSSALLTGCSVAPTITATKDKLVLTSFKWVEPLVYFVRKIIFKS